MNNGPYVICHMMESIDGCIASGKGRRTEEWKPLLKGYNKYYKIEKKFKANAWLCGRVTAEIYAYGKNIKLPQVKGNERSSDNIVFQKLGTNYAIVIDTKGQLRWKTNKLFGDHLVIIATKSTPKNYLAYLKNNGISYIIGGRKEINFSKVFQTLKTKLHIRRLLIEGGGILNGSILKAGLIDEISILIVPLVVGSVNAPSVFDTEPLLPNELPKRFQLFDLKQLKDDLIWVRYKAKK